MSDFYDPLEKLEFLAGIRADIVGYTNTNKDKIIQIKEKIFSDAISKCKTYHELTNAYHFESRAGDDIIIIVLSDHIAKLIDFAEELTQNLKIESRLKREYRSEFIDDVEVRIGIHAGNGYVKKDTSNKIISITGNIMNNLKRVTDIGSERHVLLTENAVNTISALTTRFNKNVYSAKKYPIKHGKHLDVWSYYNPDTKTGRRDLPIRPRFILLVNLTKRNYYLALSLIFFSGLGFTVGLITFFDDPSTVELNNIKKALQDEIQNKYLKLIQDKRLIENIVQQQLEQNSNYDKITLNHLLTQEKRNELNTVLTDIIDEDGIKYSWISKLKPEFCTITLYKPYDKVFVNITDFRDRPWCTNLNYYDTYLTETYYASGPHDYVNTLVSKIVIELPDGKSKTIGFLGKALEWNEIIPQSLSSSNDPRLILTDNKGFVAFDCTVSGCKDLDQDPIGFPNQIPVKYNSSYFDNANFLLSFETTNADFINPLDKNTKILNDWKLILIFQNTDMIMKYIIFISLSVIFGLIVYYYLVPRDWFGEEMIKESK